MGDKIKLFNQDNLLSGKVLETVTRPMEISAQEVAKSVSVGESLKEPVSNRLFNTYQALVDRFQPLNAQTETGKVSTPYLAARLYMGVDGLVQHWLEIGRTQFSELNRFGTEPFNRPVAGKSLKDILTMGKSKKGLNLDESITRALDSVSRRIKEESVSNNEALKLDLELMRQAGELTPASYEKAIAQITESTEALTNTNDPLNLFRTYVISKHAVDLNASGIESGVDIASARSIVNNKALQERFEGASQELCISARTT